MARGARPVVADRIRIEDEVWEEAFASRISSRPPRTRPPLKLVGAERRAPTPTDVTERTAAPQALSPRPEVLPDSEPLAEPPAGTRADAPVGPPLPAPASARRTVRIQGRGAERNLPITSSRPRSRRPYESAYFQPDKLAMWAVLLGFLLVAAAMLSAHA